MTRPSSFVTVARLEAGKLKLRDVQHFNAGLAAMSDGEVLVTVAHPKATRSSRLNRLYWAGYIRPLSEHTGYSPVEMHEYLKHRYLGEQSKRFILTDSHGEVKADTELRQTVTTTILTDDEFRQYLRDIETLALALDVSVGAHESTT